MKIIIDIYYGPNKIDSYQAPIQIRPGSPPTIAIDVKPAIHFHKHPLRKHDIKHP